MRFGPVKRVAAAVGEGSMAIAFVHQYLQAARDAGRRVGRAGRRPAQLVARQPNRTSVGIGVPVLVEAIEISEPAGMLMLWVLVQPVLPPGTVQLSAVGALPTWTVNVRVSASPVATVSVTARSLAVIVAFGVKELTLFWLAFAVDCP